MAKKSHKKSSTAVTVHQPKSLIEVLVEASRDPAVNPAKMREMVTMVREPEYADALLRCQKAMPTTITKSSYNQHTRSWWIRLENLSAQIDPIIHDHGFSLSFSMLDGAPPNHHRIACDVSHTCGLTKRYWADIGYDHEGPKGGGTKSLAQGSGSSISYGRRYLKMMIFDLSPTGEDNDGQPSNVKISQEEAEDLLKQINNSGLNFDRFKAAFQVDDLRDLPKSQLKNARDRVAQYANKGFQKEKA